MSYRTDDAGSTVSTATKFTRSSILTGCAASGTTATSTTVAGFPSYCQYDSCGTCGKRRSVQSDLEAREFTKQRLGGNVSEIELSRNLTFTKRSMPRYKWSFDDFYDDVKYSDDTFVVEHGREETQEIEGPNADNAAWNSFADEAAPGISSSRWAEFLRADRNVFVDELTGCTSLVVVSRKGAWMSHFWEAPAMAQRTFQEDVLDYIQMGRPGGEPGTVPLRSVLRSHFRDSDLPHIFIMTPSNHDGDLTKDMSIKAKLATLDQGNNVALFGQGEYRQRESLLLQTGSLPSRIC